MTESESSLYFPRQALLSLSDALEIATKVEVRKWCGRALRNACFLPVAMVSRKTLNRKFSWDPKSVWDICWISAEEAWKCAPVVGIEAHGKLCEQISVGWSLNYITLAQRAQCGVWSELIFSLIWISKIIITKLLDQRNAPASESASNRSPLGGVLKNTSHADGPLS